MPSPVTGPTVSAALAAGLIVALLCLVAPAGPLAGSPAAAQETVVDATVEPEELIPDISLLLSGATVEDPEALVESLESIDGVVHAAVESPGGPDPLVHLALDEGSGRARPVQVVADQAEAVVAQQSTGSSEISAGGSALVDREMVGRYGRSANALVWLGLVVGALFALVIGWRRGIAVAVSVAAAVLAAGRIGLQAAGPHDGTMATSALPGALAGLVVAVAVAYRLVIWFRVPSVDDGATRIERAVTDLGPELVLVGAGLIATSLLVEPLNPGRSPVTVVTVGAIVGAIVVLALLAPALAVLVGDQKAPRAHLLPLWVPDGRDLPLPILGLATLALVILSIASLGRTGGPLPGVGDLAENGEPRLVADAQARFGGDPTDGMVALAPDATAADFAGWSASVAELADVAWVDLGTTRLTSTGPVDVDPSALLSSPSQPDVAVIVPAVSPRSTEGQALVDGIGSVPLAGGPAQLIGEAAVSAGVAGSRGTVLAAIALLALAGAVSIVALTGNKALALVGFGLRLLGGAAVVGLHNLAAGDPSTASALTALAVVGVGSALSEAELVRRLEHESEPAAPETNGSPPPVGPVPGPLGSNPGQFGAAGVLAAAVGGLVIALAGPLGGGPGTMRLGIALLLAGLVEVIVGAGLLRPALLGQRSAYQTAARPFRVAVHGRSTGDPQAETPPDDDPVWREVVVDLLQTEFWLQTEPEGAQLDLVFAADTPVHRQAALRHANLVGSGLRVVGRSPELRSLRTVRDRLPVILTVTVDHPESQLLDREGHVVGVRRPERRVGRLWLTTGSDGSHRIVESVEMGTTPLGDGSADA